MNVLTEEEQSIIKYKAENKSNYEIAELIYGDKYYEYKIRRFLKSDKFILSQDSQQIVEGYNGDKDINILYFDIECSPCLSWHFNHWGVNIREEHKQRQSHLLSVAYAWNDGPVQGLRLTPEDVKNEDDLTLVVEMMEQINKADVIVGYNSKKFDVKVVNTRALYHGLMPTKIAKHIDLYEQTKRLFKFPSNSMGNVSKYLGLQGKLEHEGWALWENSMNWQNADLCNEYLQKMLDYNLQDIVATRDYYKLIQGWVVNGPNLGTIRNVKTGNVTQRCPKCGCDDLSPVEQLTYTSAKSWELYRCNNKKCNGVSKLTKNAMLGA